MPPRFASLSKSVFISLASSDDEETKTANLSPSAERAIFAPFGTGAVLGVEQNNGDASVALAAMARRRRRRSISDGASEMATTLTCPRIAVQLFEGLEKYVDAATERVAANTPRAEPKFHPLPPVRH
jgi:hypothetical protein